MISLDTKTETSSGSSPLYTKTKEEEPTLSFSELLRGVATKKDDLKDSPIVLDLEEDTKLSKSDMLLALLKGEAATLKEEPLELNPKLTEALSPSELKTLLKDAKQFLKHQILQSDGFKRSEIKELPKTLKGLAQVAQKYGIDISKITLEKVQPEKPLKFDTKTSTPDDGVIEPIEVKTHKIKKELQTSNDLVDDTRFQEEFKNQTKKSVDAKELKTTPLFKAQTQTEHSTEQIVQTKLHTVEQKTPKEKADETLKMLLRGEKASKADTGFTADFSVATARVIAPSAKTQASKSLESLLRGDTKDDNAGQSKLDGLNVNKADSFEVKLNEAKQMTKYLSQDVKTAIEDYKSPFTRVKVQLNPQRLGEVDLTIVQRGKNLHINLSSNNAAINALAMNANDLKVQLQNNGINNASLNFNNSSQNGEQTASQQQQQHQQREQQAGEEYNYFTTQEENEEILSSLEIVVPHYA